MPPHVKTEFLWDSMVENFQIFVEIFKLESSSKILSMERSWTPWKVLVLFKNERSLS